MSLNFAVDFAKHSLTGFVEHTMKVGNFEETEENVNKKNQKDKKEEDKDSKGAHAISQSKNNTKEESKPVKFVILDY